MMGPMQPSNVLGDELIPCSMDPLTGYYRSGCCENRGDDPGLHVVCCQVTEEFLRFSVEHGNDLVTPSRSSGSPGLRAGRPVVRVRGAVGRGAGGRGGVPRRARRGPTCPRSSTSTSTTSISHAIA